MKKLKKVLVSFGALVVGLVSKVFAVMVKTMTIEPKYGIFETKYGVIEPTMGEKISSVGKVVVPIILLGVGLFVILSKKITNKVKAIVVSILAILGILCVILLNYLSKNI